MNQSTLSVRAGGVATLLVAWVALAGTAVEAGNLDRYLQKQMRKARVPGLATAIVVDDRVVQLAGYGWADPELETPVTPDTVFLLASVSKLFTATTSMRLVERRQLDLDADVNDYLAFAVRNPNHPAEPITLRQLLTHTASIKDDGFYQRLEELVVAGDWPGMLTQFLIDYLTPSGRYYDVDDNFQDFAPGAEARYSNVGLALVAALVEAVTGASFEAVSRELIFNPLGMTETSWWLANLDADHVAVPCGWDGETFFAYPHMGLAAYPAGSLRTSALQLSNFARLHLNRGRFEGRRVLGRKTAKQMVRVQFVAADTDFGLGFALTRDEGQRIAHHRGGFLGAATWLWLGLDEGIGIVLLTNGEPVEHGIDAVHAFIRIKDRLFKEGRRIAARGRR